MSETPWLDAYEAVNTLVRREDADAKGRTVGETMDARVRAAFAHLVPADAAGAPARPHTCEETMTTPTMDLDAVRLARGAHKNPEEGGCIMECQ